MNTERIEMGVAYAGSSCLMIKTKRFPWAISQSANENFGAYF